MATTSFSGLFASSTASPSGVVFVISGTATIPADSEAQYYLGPTADAEIPAAADASKRIFIGRSWADVDPAAQFILDGAEILTNPFPSTGNEVVELWPDPAGLVGGAPGWVVMSTAAAPVINGIGGWTIGGTFVVGGDGVGSGAIGSSFVVN